MNFPVQPTNNYINPPGTPLPDKRVGFGSASNKARWDDGIKWGTFPEKQWTLVRFYGDVFMLATSWIKNQKSGKNFPMLCTNYDPATKSFSRTGCPIMDEFNPKGSAIQAIKDITPRQHGYAHAIFRTLQQTPGVSKPWMPVKLPISLILKIQQLSGMNVHTIDGVAYEADVTDPYWGADVYINYDSSARADSKYNVQIGPRCPLTEAEREYLNQQYDWSSLIVWPSPDEVRRALRENGYYELINPQAPGSQMVAPPPPPPAPGGFAPPPPSFPNQGQGFAPPPQQGGFPQASAGFAPPPADVGRQQPAPFMPPPMEAPAFAPPPPVQPQSQFGMQPPQQFGMPQVPQAPHASHLPPPPQAPTAPQAPIPPPTLAPRVTGGEGDDEIPFNGAAVTAAAQVAPSAPVSDKLFRAMGRGKGLTAPEMQEAIQSFSVSAKRALVRWERNDDFKGMEVPVCHASYRGDPACMKCPTRSYCIEG